MSGLGPVGVTRELESLRAALAKAEAERDSERARADRAENESQELRAVIRDANRLAWKGVSDITDGTWLSEIALILEAAMEPPTPRG